MKNPGVQTFADYVGQPRAKKIIQILCRSANRHGGSVGHILLSGPPGLGKSTLARLIAVEMGSQLHELVGSDIASSTHLAKYLGKVGPRDVVLIDEIHGLGRGEEELLYGAMQEGRIPRVDDAAQSLFKSLGIPDAGPPAMMELPIFTLVGATTLCGQLSSPLRSRFAQTITLEPYSVTELTEMIIEVSKRLDFVITQNVAEQIAGRSRGTARDAMQHLRWYAEYCSGMDIESSSQAVQDAFDLLGINGRGLTALDIRYMRALIESDHPQGLHAMAVHLNETAGTVMHVTEPFLLREGLIQRISRGRMVTEKGSEYLREHAGAIRED